jgi:hypothetical protein
MNRLIVAVIALWLVVPAVVSAQAQALAPVSGQGLGPVSPVGPSITVLSPTDTPSLRWPLIVYAAVGSADFASTIVAEKKGAVEGNPFIPDFGWNDRHPTIMLLEGAALETVVVVLATKFVGPSHHTIATVLLYGIAGGRSALIVHNLQWTRPAWEGSR